MRPRIGLLAAVGLTRPAHYGSDTEARPGRLVEVRDSIAAE
jgi:hypothetical protein